MGLLAQVDIQADSHPLPNELPNPIPQDQTHGTYDAAAEAADWDRGIGAEAGAASLSHAGALGEEN
jgi:hypothetical protein